MSTFEFFKRPENLWSIAYLEAYHAVSTALYTPPSGSGTKPMEHSPRNHAARCSSCVGPCSSICVSGIYRTLLFSVSTAFSSLGESLVLQPSMYIQRGHKELNAGLQQAHTRFDLPLSIPVALPYDLFSALCFLFMGLFTCSNGHHDCLPSRAACNYRISVETGAFILLS